jgi:Bacterial TSP3 repeat
MEINKKIRWSVSLRWTLAVALAVAALLGSFDGIRQSLLARDSDGDGLSDREEAKLGTDPYKADTDGDGLLDGWEVAGIVPPRNGPGLNLVPVAIAGANPLRKDIFVEVDWMVDATHSHRFRRAGIDRVEDAFTRAPVQNPSGETGVDIHIDTGQLGGGGDELEHQTLLPTSRDFLSIPGFGNFGQGAAVAVGDIDRNGTTDMLIAAYDNPAGANSFRYQIGWNIDRDGKPTSQAGVPGTPWSGVTQVEGVGNEGQGMGARLVDLDGNGQPELVLMAYDNPAGPNSFRYRIGWNLDINGTATSWSDIVQVAGVGNEGQGAGLTFTNLDNNPRPEMILMAYDHPSGPSSFRYKIGWNVGKNGIAASWSGFIQVAGVGNEAQGAGVDVLDMDGNGQPEMVFMANYNPSGANEYRYRIGWNMNSGGVAQQWQDGYDTYTGAGNEADGAGMAVANLDGGRNELIFLTYNAPAGPNEFRYNILYNIDAAGNAVDYDYFKARNFNPARAGIYRYMIFAHDIWGGGSTSGVAFSSRDFVVTLGSWKEQTGTDDEQSGAFMHELGHTLGLAHGGSDDVNNKPNYQSVMNYLNTYSLDVDFDGDKDGPLDYSHGLNDPLNELCLDENKGVARFYQTEGVGNEGEGADIAVWDLDDNGIQDMLVLANDAPSGPNTIRYRIGYDLTARGVPRRWSGGHTLQPGMGVEGQGAGVELADLDGNGRPEVIVLVNDNPPGANNLRYRIGWNLNAKGETSNWGPVRYVSGMGDEAQGAGIVLAQIDTNPRPDLVVMVYDNPPGANNFRYKIGWNVGTGGDIPSWSSVTQVNGVGDEGQGAGVAIANLDTNPRPEMIFMAYDAPQGPNSFRFRTGMNLNTSGIATGWTRFEQQISGVGNEGQGAGIRALDFNANGVPDLILMAYDNPPGPNNFRFVVSRDLAGAGNLKANVGFPRDWNKNDTMESCVNANINSDLDGDGNPIIGVLTDNNDWAHLVY